MAFENEIVFLDVGRLLNRRRLCIEEINRTREEKREESFQLYLFIYLFIVFIEEMKKLCKAASKVAMVVMIMRERERDLVTSTTIDPRYKKMGTVLMLGLGVIMFNDFGCAIQFRGIVLRSRA